MLASSNPSRMEPKDQKVCMLVHKLSYWNAKLKVPKCENFHPFNYRHFNTIKPVRIYDCKAADQRQKSRKSVPGSSDRAVQGRSP
jgi:hypothetical protein